MTELMRPALYGAFHRIEPVAAPAAGDHQYEIVGPVCESSDVVGRDRMLPHAGDRRPGRDSRCRRLRSGDGVQLQSTSAAAEVLVDAGTWRVIRRRQTVDDQLALET